MRSKILKFPATLGKSGVYLLITTATATATGLGLAFQFIPKNDNNNSRHSSLTSSHSIPALFHAFLRSSRAISTVRLSLSFFFFLFWGNNLNLNLNLILILTLYCRLLALLLTTSILYMACRKTLMTTFANYLRFFLIFRWLFW
jgi:hypothetical protein